MNLHEPAFNKKRDDASTHATHCPPVGQCSCEGLNSAPSLLN